jgi:hypothetical protein
MLRPDRSVERRAVWVAHSCCQCDVDKAVTQSVSKVRALWKKQQSAR